MQTTTHDTRVLRQQVALLTGRPISETPVEASELKWCIKACAGKRVVKTGDFTALTGQHLETKMEAAYDAEGRVIGHTMTMRKVLESAVFVPGTAEPSVEDVRKAQAVNFKALTNTIGRLADASSEERDMFTRALSKISMCGELRDLQRPRATARLFARASCRRSRPTGRIRSGR